MNGRCGMTIFFLVKSFLLLACLGLALYYDLREQKIKNAVTLPAAFLGLAVNFLEQGPAGLVFSGRGWLVPILFLTIFYYLQVMGAGDIKLFAAIGAIMGLSFAFLSFVFAVYLGGIIAVVILLKRKRFRERMVYLANYLKVVFYTRKISVYGPADDLNAKFCFTTAIIPGAVLEWSLTVLKIKGLV